MAVRVSCFSSSSGFHSFGIWCCVSGLLDPETNSIQTVFTWYTI